MHDVKAARRHGLVHALTGHDIGVLADRGYQGAAGTIRVPFRDRDLPTGPTAVNTAHARLRAPGERGPAPSKPGACSTGRAAAPNAAPTSSPPSSPSKPPPETQVGKGSRIKRGPLYQGTWCDQPFLWLNRVHSGLERL